MRPERIIEEVAKLDGWFLHGRNSLIMYKTSDNKPDGCVTEESHIEAQKLSRYLTSRDAIVPVIEEQERKIRRRIATLFFSVNNDEKDNMLKLLTATPSQLCEALLRATNKWRMINENC